MIITGRARVVGDDVNTDYVISSARKRETIDPVRLAPFLFESIAPRLAATIAPGDVLVAGTNFGCGSAMEVAVTVIQAAGLRAVVAKSFARSFFRNAINNGLLVVECETSSIVEGDRLSLHVTDESASIENLTHGGRVAGVPLPPIMQRILAHGGLVGYLGANRRFDA